MNIGTTKSIEIGGRTHCVSFDETPSCTSHCKKHSKSPGNFLSLHTIAAFSGSYFALPTSVLQVTDAVFFGHGIFTTTFVALSVLSKIDLSLSLTYSFCGLICVMTGMSLKGRLMLSLIRYYIRSKTPSGGIKVMERSLSNLGSFTHWWNFISSMVMPLSLVVTPAFLGYFYMRSLSFMPSLHSGIPVRRHLSLMVPVTSALRTVPLTDMRT